MRDVLGYRKAIEEATKGDISVSTMERICSVLKGKQMHIRSKPEDTVFLKDSQGNIVSKPPSGDLVPSLLNNLIEYVDISKHDPLIRIIVFHALFEIIHPFKDGNGRTGRIINEVLLQKYGLLGKPVLFLSKFLIENRRDYYRFLRKVERDNDWCGFIYFMLCGIRDSSIRTISLIKRIDESLHHAYAICENEGFSKEIVNQLYSHMYVRAKHLVDANLVSRNTASAYLLKLEKIGILSGEQAGKGKIYLNTDLYRILSTE